MESGGQGEGRWVHRRKVGYRQEGWTQAQEGSQMKVGWGWRADGSGLWEERGVLSGMAVLEGAREFQAGAHGAVGVVTWARGTHSWGQAHRGAGAMAAAVG